MALGATVKVKMDTSAVKRGMTNIGGMFKKLGGFVKGIGAGLASRMKMMAIPAVAIGFATKKLAEYGQELKAVSSQTGIAVRDILAIREAFRLSGGEVSDQADLISDFQEKLNDARRNAGTAREGLGPLGLTLADFTPDKTPFEQLKLLLDTVDKSTLRIDQIADALDKVFGGQGFKVITLAKNFKAFLEDARASTGKLAKDLEDGLLDRLVETNREIILMTTELKRLSLQLVTKLPIEDIAKMIRQIIAELNKLFEGGLSFDKLGKFVVRFGELIGEGIANTLAGQQGGIGADWVPPSLLKGLQRAAEELWRFLAPGKDLAPIEIKSTKVESILMESKNILDRIERKEGAIFA